MVEMLSHSFWLVFLHSFIVYSGRSSLVIPMLNKSIWAVFQLSSSLHQVPVKCGSGGACIEEGTKIQKGVGRSQEKRKLFSNAQLQDSLRWEERWYINNFFCRQ